MAIALALAATTPVSDRSIDPSSVHSPRFAALGHSAILPLSCDSLLRLRRLVAINPFGLAISKAATTTCLREQRTELNQSTALQMNVRNSSLSFILSIHSSDFHCSPKSWSILAAANSNIGLVKYSLSHGQPVNSVLVGIMQLHAAPSGGSDLIVQLLMPDANASR
jgi:hypothetical protein